MSARLEEVKYLTRINTDCVAVPVGYSKNIFTAYLKNVKQSNFTSSQPYNTPMLILALYLSHSLRTCHWETAVWVLWAAWSRRVAYTEGSPTRPDSAVTDSSWYCRASRSDLGEGGRGVLMGDIKFNCLFKKEIYIEHRNILTACIWSRLIC